MSVPNLTETEKEAKIVRFGFDEPEITERHMYDLSDWHKISCVESDELRTGMRVFSTLTDMDGAFGEPIIYTEWGVSDPDRAILREYRWPNDLSKVCTHWVPDAIAEARS